MRKLPLTAALLAAFAVSLAAQEGTVLLDVGNYSKSFLNGNGSAMSSKYLRVAPKEDLISISTLEGDSTSVDTPLEIALLSTCAGVIDIRPVEAQRMLPAGDARQAGLKLGSAVLKELAELKFLDPSNTAAIGRYEGMIKYISDKNGVSRADIENYLRAGIVEMVDTEFNKGMRGGIIPAVVYAQWKKNNVASGADAMQILKDCISDFFINPTKENYDRLFVIMACYDENRWKFNDQLALFSAISYTQVLISLSEQIQRKIEIDISDNRAALAQIAKSDRELFVFLVRYSVGGDK